jgi:hypothetical protein
MLTMLLVIGAPSCAIYLAFNLGKADAGGRKQGWARQAHPFLGPTCGHSGNGALHSGIVRANKTLDGLGEPLFGRADVKKMA